MSRDALDYAVADLTALIVPDGPKMLKETLCVAQARIGNSPYDEGRKREHIARLQRLIDECDRHRPVGSDGKHGNLHTPTCGCGRIAGTGKRTAPPPNVPVAADVAGDEAGEVES